MTLDIARLALDIEDEIEARLPVITDAQLKLVAEAIATAVIEEFTNNAVVVVTGVQAGGSTVNGTIT